MYEDDAFFDTCDAEGILVWQDFAMGCTFYPQNRDFAAKVEQEVRSVVRKLRNHPCLALWSGNNEDDVSLTWQLGGFNIDPNRDLISRQTIPAVLYESRRSANASISVAPRPIFSSFQRWVAHAMR